MFSKLMQEPAEEEEREPPSLWDQCFMELRRLNRGSASLEEVNRLVLLVSHRVLDGYKEIVHETASDAVNGFVDKLPF